MLDNAGCCGLLLLCLPRQCFDGRAAFADHPHTVGSAFEIACDFVGSPACKFVESLLAARSILAIRHTGPGGRRITTSNRALLGRPVASILSLSSKNQPTIKAYGLPSAPLRHSILSS
jgi:hypothetical protein